MRSAASHMCRALRPAEMQRSTECATPASAPRAAWRSPLAALCGALRAPLPAAPGSEATEPAGAPVFSDWTQLMENRATEEGAQRALHWRLHLPCQSDPTHLRTARNKIRLIAQRFTDVTGIPSMHYLLAMLDAPVKQGCQAPPAARLLGR